MNRRATPLIRTVPCVIAAMTALAIAGQARGQVIRTVDEGPVHEAFVQPVTEFAGLEAVDREPPPPITERIAAPCDPAAQWIPGYWEWMTDRDDFVWVSGVWRKAPPGRHWIAGFWKQYDEGWVRIRGFWNDAPEEAITYIELPPPDQLDDTVPAASGSAYFWLPGYWNYLPLEASYQWLYGHWEPLNPDWIWVPAHYVFRTAGYVFLAGYWDWPIERRGCAYACVYIEPAARITIVYEPVVIIEPDIIIHHLFVWYPDYIYVLYHHHHFHLAWWDGFMDTPPWWGWDSWWAFSWHDHWGLWWWYTHPGYPHPAWMTAALASHIHPPSDHLLLAMKKLNPPPVVTPNGVVPPSKPLGLAGRGGLKKSPGKKLAGAPILPPGRKDHLTDIGRPGEPVAKAATKPLVPSGIKAAAGAIKPGTALGERPPKPKVTALPKTPKPPLQPTVKRIPRPDTTQEADGKPAGRGTEPALPKGKPEFKPGGPPIKQPGEIKPATPALPKQRPDGKPGIKAGEGKTLPPTAPPKTKPEFKPAAPATTLPSEPKPKAGAGRDRSTAPAKPAGPPSDQLRSKSKDQSRVGPGSSPSTARPLPRDDDRSKSGNRDRAAPE